MRTLHHYSHLTSFHRGYYRITSHNFNYREIGVHHLHPSSSPLLTSYYRHIYSIPSHPFHFTQTRVHQHHHLQPSLLTSYYRHISPFPSQPIISTSSHHLITPPNLTSKLFTLLPLTLFHSHQNRILPVYLPPTTHPYPKTFSIPS